MNGRTNAFETDLSLLFRIDELIEGFHELVNNNGRKRQISILILLGQEETKFVLETVKKRLAYCALTLDVSVSLCFNSVIINGKLKP